MTAGPLTDFPNGDPAQESSVGEWAQATMEWVAAGEPQDQWPAVFDTLHPANRDALIGSARLAVQTAEEG